MKITIEIPSIFEFEWEKNRFAESLGRLSADAYCAAGEYERETARMLIQAFVAATVKEDDPDD